MGWSDRELMVRIVSPITHEDMTEDVVQTPHVIQNVATSSTPNIVPHFPTQATMPQATA